jgi:hypothetical protein
MKALEIPIVVYRASQDLRKRGIRLGAFGWRL